MRRVATFLGLVLAGCGLSLPAMAQTLPSTNTRAVATFESLGLYWTPPSSPGALGCQVRYQKVGDTAWKDGLTLWYDARNKECRGSLVQLAPGTSYVVQFSMPAQSPSAQLTATTWSETFPIANTVYLPNGTTTQTYAITSGGSPSGYVLYTFPAGGQSTIDVGNTQTYDVTISAPYVILRGLTLKGAKADAIRLLPGAHDVVIEGNDISGWGRFRTSSAEGDLGVDEDSGVHAVCSDSTLERVIIQRNKIHDPRYTANSWSVGHPAGPQGISFDFCGGNHVIRYNEIVGGSSGHYYNDAIGGADNLTTTGFPNYDSDIYGNLLKNTWDDAIEAEGGDRNVRIWGNYIDQTATGVASTVVAIGPLYVFRNVYNRSRKLAGSSLDADDRLFFSKSGSVSSTIGNGRRYLFHNTMLQATQSGATYPLGAGVAISGTGSTQLISNTVSRNNIFQIWKTNWPVIDQAGANNDFGYDLYNGNLSVTDANGIKGVPIYVAGNGWSSEAGGLYQLASNSPGYDRGTRIPNFNDNFLGAAPDIGAHEAGSPAMQFGVNAYLVASAPTPTPTPTPTPSPTPTPTPTPTPSYSYAGTPYTGTPIAIPGRFEAENFDRGGEGVAYHDTTASNLGGAYRTGEGVDIIASTDTQGGGYVINNFTTGEWLNYTINAVSSGSYSIQLRISNNYGPSVAFHLEIDGVPVTASLLIPRTGGWSTFQWIATPAISIAAGKHVLRITTDQQYFNLNSVNVVALSLSTTPTTTTTTPPPTTTTPPPTTTTTTPPPTTTATIPTTGVSWSCDFENDYCGFLEQSKLGDAPPSARRSSLVATARSGKLGVRLHTESGDNNVHGSGTWERDDLSYGPSSAYCNQGQEEWWAHSVLFPDDYVFPPVGGEAGIILDFHHNYSSGQANFEVQTIPGIGLRLEGHGGPTISEGRYDFVITDPYGAPAGSVTKNVWYDFVYHVKWNSSSSGLIEAWLNGKKVMTYNGPTLYSGISCYLKLANYHGAFGKASSVIHDRVIRGTSATAVSITPLSP